MKWRQKASFEEVAYPVAQRRVTEWKAIGRVYPTNCRGTARCRARSTEMLRLFLPNTAHPMDMLRTGVSMLSAFDKDLSDQLARRPTSASRSGLIARVSTLITDGWAHFPWEKTRCRRQPDLTQARQFLL